MLRPMFAPAPAAPAATSPDEPAAATGRPPPRRPRGPVLIADLLTAANGRPLLLAHWDREAEGSGRR